MIPNDPSNPRVDIRGFGRGPLSLDARKELAEVTAQVLAAAPSAVAEFTRYLDVRKRQIDLPEDRLFDHLGGKTVLVTGDTGCIGSALLTQLSRYGVGNVWGISLDGSTRLGACSTQLDVADGPALQAVISDLRPDLVFHLAAQRDPGFAERSVRRTLATNVLGTHNVVRACETAGVSQLVFASTGKAVRPYSTNVYTSSKRLSERIVSDATVRGTLSGSVARFTHVVDNAIVLERLRGWCRAGDMIRLHDMDTLFYVQSAIESAQLLLASALAPADGICRIHAIRNLDWPINLLDLALGTIAECGYRSVPIQEIGHEPGYDANAYPGLYDPMYSGGVSPLLNAMEAPTVEPSASLDADAARGQATLTAELTGWLHAVEHLVMIDDVSLVELRSTFDAFAWADLLQTINDTPAEILLRISRLTASHRSTMIEEHSRIDDAIRQRIQLPVSPGSY